MSESDELIREPLDHGNETMYAESLPENCPPSQASAMSNFEGFRLLESNSPSIGDFDSHAAKWPHKYGTKCKDFAVSIFSDRTALERLLAMPVHCNKTIAKVSLNPESGPIQQTGGDPFHYSWWRYRDFDVLNACEVIG